MDRDKLKRLKLAELQALARKQNIADVERLRREQLIDRLAPAETAPASKGKGVLGRARQAAREAIAKRKTRPPQSPRKKSEEPEAPPPGTETMARLYEEQGHHERALEIYRRMLDEDPERQDLRERMARLVHTPAPPPPVRTGEPVGMLDYEELPETYGVDEVAVMPKDPQSLFVYWEVTPEGRAAARAQLGSEAHAARLILRMQRVPEPGEIRDTDLDWDHGRRYLAAPAPGARLLVAVGLLAPSGAFAPIAHSAVVRVPFAEPGPEGPVEWMEVIPAKTRGATFEPILIVARGRERITRGAPHWDQGAWRHPGSRLPLLPELAAPPEQGASSQLASQRLRWPGSSEQAVPTSKSGTGSDA